MRDSSAVTDAGAGMSGPLEPLLERTLAGDRAAAAALMRVLAPAVHARVLRVLRRRAGEAPVRREDVLDGVQDVFVVLLERDARVLRAWRPSGGLSLVNFVGLVAERETISFARSGRRSAWAEAPTEEECLEHLQGSHRIECQVETRHLLDRVLDHLYQALSPRGLALFRALYLEERELAEVCEQFDMTRTAMYSFRHRLRNMVTTLVGRRAGSEPPTAPARAAHISEAAQ